MIPIFIGIAGASASGKSLISQTIRDELEVELGQNTISILKEDSYYKDHCDLTLEQRVNTNYDHPRAFDHGLLIEHLNALAQQKTVNVPIYDYKTHSRSTETNVMQPARVVIVEGILLFNDKEIRNILDAKVFMDTDLDICLLRRLKRDTEERGRSISSILLQYEETVRPMFLEFILPSKQFADIVVPRGGMNRIVIEMLKAHIKQIILS
jgi:uridine kinase